MKHVIFALLVVGLLFMTACQADEPSEPVDVIDAPDEGVAEPAQDEPFEVPQEDGFDLEFDASEYDVE